MRVPSKTPTSELAGFISAMTYERLPPEVVGKAKECILDSLGAALGGSRAAGMDGLVQAVARYGSRGRAAIWGTCARAAVPMAALINGTMAHALELDDVHREAKAHAGAVVVPAALTLGEAEMISGKDLLVAVVCGYEIMLRVGAGIGAASHRNRGWHATGTCGTFGAAAAAGKILGLGARQLLWAIGLAGTQSSGLWAFTADGAENKKFHAGRAAESGILAAVLAGAGMSGPGHILEAEDGGLYPATSDNYRLEAVTEELGRRFLISEVSVKPFACCRSMHPAIDAAIKLRRRHGVDPVRIERVVVGTYEVAVRQCGFTKQPKSTAEAQFSLPYGVAAALADGNALLDQFSESRIRDRELLELAGRVELTVDPEMDRLYPKKWGCRLRIEMSDGSILAGEVASAKGDPENPLSGQEMKDKFLWLAQEAVGTARSHLLVELVDNLDKLDTVLPLTRLLLGE